MEQPQHPAAELEIPLHERALVDPQLQAELWNQVISAAASEQELLLMRESLIYALPPRAIYALHPDQFASVAAIYHMKQAIFARLQRNQAIARLHAAWATTPSQDT